MSTDQPTYSVEEAYHNALQRVEDALGEAGYEVEQYELRGIAQDLLARPEDEHYAEEQTLSFNHSGLMRNVYERKYGLEDCTEHELLRLYLKEEQDRETPVVGSVEITEWPQEEALTTDEKILPVPIDVQYHLSETGPYLSLDDSGIAGSYQDERYEKKRGRLETIVSDALAELPDLSEDEPHPASTAEFDARAPADD